jgi:hypothetical protein
MSGVSENKQKNLKKFPKPESVSNSDLCFHTEHEYVHKRPATVDAHFAGVIRSKLAPRDRFDHVQNGEKQPGTYETACEY